MAVVAASALTFEQLFGMAEGEASSSPRGVEPDPERRGGRHRETSDSSRTVVSLAKSIPILAIHGRRGFAVYSFRR
jgi:hypothetical protein